MTFAFTRRGFQPREVLQDVRAFNVDFSHKVPFWFSSEGGQIKYDIDDLASLSLDLKDVLKKMAIAGSES